jgi:hypothetical protein
MLRFLVKNDQYNTIRPLIMSELYKQWLKHFFFSWCIRALSVLPDSWWQGQSIVMRGCSTVMKSNSERLGPQVLPPEPNTPPSKPLRQWAKVADPALAS